MMTLKRYAHILENIRDDAARAMDELFQDTSSLISTPLSVERRS